MKTLLRQPPPLSFLPDAESDSSPADFSELLRYLWFTSRRSTRQLAVDLDISQPHLIRLLRGDRNPSRALRARIATLAPLLLVGE